MYDTGIGERSHEAWACLTLDYIIWYGTGLECSGHGSIFCPLPNRAWWSYSTQPSLLVGASILVGSCHSAFSPIQLDPLRPIVLVTALVPCHTREERRTAYTSNTDQVPLFWRTLLVLFKYSGSTAVRAGKLSIVVQFCTK